MAGVGVKLRFSTADVKAQIRDIRARLLGCRVSNVYDSSEKVYIFKFSSQGSNEKPFLVVESGIRFHLTKFMRDAPDHPSPFTMKLRKLIRTKKLEGIKQIGEDRVIDLRFGSGDAVIHVILELYANGNIVLTDGNYQVISLLRSHKFSEDVALKVDEVYPILFSTNIGASDMDIFNAVDARRKMEAKLSTDGGEKKSKKGTTAKQFFLSKESGFSSLGPEIVEHCLLKSSLKANMKLEDLLRLTDEQLTAVLESFKEGFQIVAALDNSATEQIGYIIVNERSVQHGGTATSTVTTTADIAAAVDYVEYVPVLLQQHKHKKYLEFPSFNDAVDEYYGKIEDQKLRKAAQAAEESALRKIDKVKEEHEKMLRGLNLHQEKMELSAALLELYAKEVDKACLVINSALSNGMDWDDIGEMVDNEKQAGNPVAGLITKLLLDRNQMALRLKNVYFEGTDSSSGGGSGSDTEGEDEEGQDSEEEEVKEQGKRSSRKGRKEPKKDKETVSISQLEYVDVVVDLALTAHANACNLYSHKKSAKEKEIRTIQASEKVIQNVEEQTLKSLEKQKLKRSLQATRKVHWFEKFNWFITSEGYLVLSGRYAQQNELLFKRYLRPFDLYVHADLHGASSCIIRAKKAPEGGVEGGSSKSGQQTSQPTISPLAIQEAGMMAVCRSSAWSSKIITSAWWVFASQVSKSAPTGEYLTTGSFMIYGKKNFLPPMPLEMGFGILFRLDDGSVARHMQDYKDRALLDDMETMSVFTDVCDRYGLDVQALTIGAAEGQEGEPAPAAASDTAPAVPETIEVSKSETTKPVSKKERTQAKSSTENKQPKQKPDLPPGKGAKSTEKSSNKKLGKPAPGKTALEAAVAVTQAEDHAAELEDDTALSTTDNTAIPGLANKKKFINKKKARRYAEQDEDEKELAMLILGHTSNRDGEKLIDKELKIQKEKKQKELKQKQEKVGLKHLTEDWAALLQQLSEPVRAVAQEMVAEGVIKEGELDAYEVRDLTAFPDNVAVEILNLFRDDKNIRKIANKSGFLAGIMRRKAKEMMKGKVSMVVQSSSSSSAGATTASTEKTTTASSASALAEGDPGNDEPAEETAQPEVDEGEEEVGGEKGLSRRERKRQAKQEIAQILEEEGVLDEEEGKQADELEKLTGFPFEEDTLLYAVSVCAPYPSLLNFKYKVKLTPGTVKKGKACKQAIELFTRAYTAKEDSTPITVQEKAMIKGLTDAEVIATMIGDVKLSMPGLYQHKQVNTANKKSSGKGQKKH